MQRQAQGYGQRGFTLIELMVAVAIVAILASIAYPAYTRQIQKGARRAAQAQMLDLANREQQYLLSNRTYADYSILTGAGYSLPTELTSKYTPAIACAPVNAAVGCSVAGTVPSYTITFTAIGGQASDGPLTLTSEGVKGCGTGCTASTKW